MATCVVNGPPTSGFLEAELYVGGVRVKHIELEIVMMQHMQIMAMIDSTHFTNGTSVPIYARFRDEDGVWYTSATKYVTVRNIAAVFGRHDLESEDEDDLMVGVYEDENDENSLYYIEGDASWRGCGNALTALSNIQYSIYGGEAETDLGWDWGELEPAIAESNVLYVNTHGGIYTGTYLQPYFETDNADWNFTYPSVPANFGTGNDEERIIGDTSMTLVDHVFKVMPTMQSAMGTGLPFRNSGDRPPFSFVWIDGCSAGFQGMKNSVYIDNTFPESFLIPIGNVYNPPYSAENQTFASYLIDVDIDKTFDVTEAMFYFLWNGWTVNDAREMSYEIYNPAVKPPNSYAEAHEWMAVYGDWNCRVSGVYTGSPGKETGWYW